MTQSELELKYYDYLMDASEQGRVGPIHNGDDLIRISEAGSLWEEFLESVGLTPDHYDQLEG